ncbi:hypothetical protein [Streptomyces chrestomyceticus]|uniref:hypothetical protein n=1 Tax=Streptomyces chrestomyceticus TaxID=68185 RepID=UPI001F49440B|nr:hypothetical protein [Streptomyces chrestomyceticus]
MPDRRRRAALLLPLPATAGGCPQPSVAPGPVLLRERKPSSDPAGAGAPDSSGSSGSSGPSGSSGGPARERAHSHPSNPSGSSGQETGGQDGNGQGGSDRGGSGQDGRDRDNPFAPPPADAPEQPWQPRGHGQDQDGDQDGPGDRQQPSWGNQWSSRQPGRQGGGFGTRQSGRNSQQQPGGQGGPGSSGGLRWDPTDPAQRRARYALLAGMWGFFFVLFNLPEIALLLATLALYWGVSSLRAKAARTGNGARSGSARATAADVSGQAPSRTDSGASTAGGAPPVSTRPQTTAAVAGLVTASLALAMVAATYTVQLVYRDYFTCVNDALTRSAQHSCEKLLPEQLRPLLGAEQE